MKKLKLKNRVKRALKGKVSTEETQHLRRLGVAITNKTKFSAKRPIRRFAAWWETTTIEKFFEDISFLLKNAALLEIINLVAGITIIISLITWLTTEKQRRNAEIYQAWQVITAAYNQSGSGGRKEALEFLNSKPKRFPWFWKEWEKQNLEGLAAPKAFLPKIKLQKAELFKANLQQAALIEANLQEANLEAANLQEAELFKANLQKAYLFEANLQKAELFGANLQKAYLFGANLQEAALSGANLQEANLGGAKLQKAWLIKANLQKAGLIKANLQEANLREANLQKAYLREANLQKAGLWGANLQEAYLVDAEELTSEQIKSSCFWEKAIYKGEMNDEGNWVAIEPDNTNFIEELKNDKSSDPKEPINCKIWEEGGQR